MSPRGRRARITAFPLCHANGIPDPDIKKPNACAGVVMPAALTGPHSAGLGIIFYTGEMFPKTYQNVGLHRAARLINKGAEIRLRRCAGGAHHGGRQGEDRAVLPDCWMKRPMPFTDGRFISYR